MENCENWVSDDRARRLLAAFPACLNAMAEPRQWFTLTGLGDLQRSLYTSVILWHHETGGFPFLPVSGCTALHFPCAVLVSRSKALHLHKAKVGGGNGAWVFLQWGAGVCWATGWWVLAPAEQRGQAVRWEVGLERAAGQSFGLLSTTPPNGL